MGILFWILFGALVGWIASMIMHTDERQGGLMNIVVGILGAVVGGIIMNALGYGGVSGFNLYSMVVAIMGAIIFIWIVKAIA